MLNEVKLIGNLTRDPEVRETASGTPLGKFGLGVNETYTGNDGLPKESVVFVECTVWRGGTEVLARLRKGDRLFVSGKLTLNRWSDQATGEERQRVELTAFRLIPMPREPRPAVELPREEVVAHEVKSAPAPAPTPAPRNGRSRKASANGATAVLDNPPTTTGGEDDIPF